MQTCPNCRRAVMAGAQQCPACGIRVRSGTLISLLTGISLRQDGWSLSPGLLRSRGFRVVALLVPAWLPILVAVLIGSGSPEAASFLLALFVFIPGLYVLSNLSSWSRITRLVACLLYVVVSAVVGYKVLALAMTRLA